MILYYSKFCIIRLFYLNYKKRFYFTHKYVFFIGINHVKKFNILNYVYQNNQ